MRGRRSLLAPVRISNYLTPLSRDHLRFPTRPPNAGADLDAETKSPRTGSTWARSSPAPKTAQSHGLGAHAIV